MSPSRALGRALVAALAAGVIVTTAPGGLTHAGVDTDHLRVDFEGGAPAGSVLTDGAPVDDISGHGNDGVVVTAYGGTVAVVTDPTGVGFDFPGKCSREPCPNSLVEIPENQSLDPLMNDFEWGARILLGPTETDDGENVVQKGLFNQVGGQWKLQVDKTGGLPSCVLSGRRPGEPKDRQVVLKASVGVADGRWHRVACRRTAASGLQILVDGTVRGRAAMPLVNLDSDAPVTIGSKTVIGSDNDQFHGVVDDVYMTVLNEELPVDVAPTAEFTSSCIDLQCTFDGASSTDDGPLTYAWDFGDGATDTVEQPAHAFVDAAEHSVTLTVTDAGGATASIVHTVTTTENVPPVAAFTSACTDLSCTFDGSGSTDSSPLTYAWDFGDGGSDTVVTPAHTFLGGGDHAITLTVTDASGLTGSLTQVVSPVANVPPTASFTETCTQLSCAFDASGSADTGPLTYAWTFGDGGTGTGVRPAHTFTASGTYTIALTVTDGSGASTPTQHTVTVTKPVTSISFVGRTTVSTSATNFAAAVPTNVRAGDGMLLFLSVATNATVKQPTGVTGWVAVDTLTNANGSTRVWRKVATAADAGAQVKIAVSATSKGNVTIVAYRGTSTVNPVAGFARSLLTNNSITRTTPTTNVTTPAIVVSYWMHRDSTTTALTAPAGVTVRATGTESGGGHVTVLTADSGSAAPVGPYGGLTARAAADSNLGTAWTIVLAPA